MSETCKRSRCAARLKAQEVVFQYGPDEFKLVCTKCNKFVKARVTNTGITVYPNE
jgi:hypothetical protein